MISSIGSLKTEQAWHIIFISLFSFFHLVLHSGANHKSVTLKRPLKCASSTYLSHRFGILVVVGNPIGYLAFLRHYLSYWIGKLVYWKEIHWDAAYDWGIT